MIQVQNLSKSFQNIQAVDDISFTIKKGEIFGFLGPNGAGKSTTLNMMSTILKSDAGTIYIDGKNSNKNASACKHLIGVVPQEISLYEDLSAYKNLLFWGNLYGIPSKILKERIHTTLKLIGLLDRKKDLIKTYSGGMKRRINIAAALLHHPKVLFMDEPTVGIDPQSRNHIFEVIETLNEQGMTIVYTTHYMEEVERLCDRIAIIDSGKIIAQGTQSELKELVQTKESIQLEFDFLSESNVNQLKKLLSHTLTQNKNKLLVECTVKDLSKVITACNELQLPIKDIQLNKVNLEAIFLSLTGKQLRD
ncbi:ABC-2 type transport system ATP-binding protein [Aquimarina sp. EL_43]|uniref:ABC transporter ATP-binding protein n=1 Tax=Aquimarina TaxID=290174 RepID=UPI0004713A84|nr:MULTISPECIES: ABC transporter ATP-binding protein [Aquimarina]MBG6129485.1 ABC-2 type transport system ATP-binding protein [Aquimarina sp. EL_35]MBG6150550.1 ABC-2 type transport system ATP-binding protein [Aquimarina sp. EL_32]MBG6168142.1 ABC-2 type transport system ATP-binding protein [Aquimarina sp. EL_43]